MTTSVCNKKSSLSFNRPVGAPVSDEKSLRRQFIRRKVRHWEHPIRYPLDLYLGPTIPLGLTGRRPALASSNQNFLCPESEKWYFTMPQNTELQQFSKSQWQGLKKPLCKKRKFQSDEASSLPAGKVMTQRVIITQDKTTRLLLGYLQTAWKERKQYQNYNRSCYVLLCGCRRPNHLHKIVKVLVFSYWAPMKTWHTALWPANPFPLYGKWLKLCSFFSTLLWPHKWEGEHNEVCVGRNLFVVYMICFYICLLMYLNIHDQQSQCVHCECFDKNFWWELGIRNVSTSQFPENAPLAQARLAPSLNH